MAADLARNGLTRNIADTWELGDWIGVWLAASGLAAADDILSMVSRRGALSVMARALVGQSFAAHGCFAAASSITAVPSSDRP
jgi:hypothetical protein